MKVDKVWNNLLTYLNCRCLIIKASKHKLHSKPFFKSTISTLIHKDSKEPITRHSCVIKEVWYLHDQFTHITSTRLVSKKRKLLWKRSASENKSVSFAWSREKLAVYLNSCQEIKSDCFTRLWICQLQPGERPFSMWHYDHVSEFTNQRSGWDGCIKCDYERWSGQS